MGAKAPAPRAGDGLPRMLGDRYRLEDKLGEGGMGVVYAGVHVQIERRVAVKLLKGEYASSDDVAERFLREARAAVKIQSPHVVEILDFGKSPEGELFFVMELLDGSPLNAVLKREGRLGPRRTVGIARQICDALGAAHQAGIVHRDLKPANVVVVRRKGEDFAKILDFGVAKLVGELDSQLTRTGMLVGTLECMAPEQVLGKSVDARTDVYALGVLLHRCLTGLPPFQGEGVAAMVYHHVNTKVTPLRETAPDAAIPAALDALVLRCLAKAPSERFASMAEVDAALAAAIEGAPADAPSGVVVAPDEAATMTVPTPAPLDPTRRSEARSARYDRPGGDGATRAEGGGRGPAPTRLERASSTAPRPPPAEGAAPPAAAARSKLPLVGAGVGVVLGLGVFGIYVVATGETEAPVAIEPAKAAPRVEAPRAKPPPPAPAAPAPKPPPPRPAAITVAVPPGVTGAVVWVDGKKLGPAPATFTPSSFDAVTVKVTAPKHAPVEVKVEPTSDVRTVETVLRQLPSRAPKPDRVGDDWLPM